MAADEVLLEAAGTGVASLRFYGWSTPTVSLGYFQPASARTSPSMPAELPWVRRISGGAALVHDCEVTYALALPAGAPWQTDRRGAAWLNEIHAGIARALATLGVAAAMHAGAAVEPSGEPLCFCQITPGDLAIGTAKVVGSAQRRRRGALLQHGAVLLARSRHATALAGIRELSGRELGAEELCEQIAGELAQALRWELLSADWTDRERSRIDELAQTRYRDPSWQSRR